MSDALKHECGIALIRLLKPLEYYKEKYGSAFYGINKMFLGLEMWFLVYIFHGFQLPTISIPVPYVYSIVNEVFDVSLATEKP